MKRKRPAKAPGRQDPHAEVSVLPMDLQIGDCFTAEGFEWEVLTHPTSMHGAKRLRARVVRPGVPRRNGQAYRSIRKGFRLACEAAGLTDVSPHVLRHTFASRLAMAGVDSRTIQDLGGRRSLAMVERYTHLSPTHKAAAVERIASPEFPNAIPKATTFRRGRRAVSTLQ